MAEDSRRDRELIELLNELRVVLPGIQVLFAFLLTVPFSNRFVHLDRSQRTAFFVAFLAATVASALLIAPSAFHRLRFRAHDKEAMLRYSNRMAIAGLGFLAVSMTAVVYVVTDLLYDTGPALLTTALVGIVLLGLWYALPLMRQLRDHDQRS
jgi:amino acid transporter